MSGEVQGVGYRRAVQKIARTLNVVGYVRNQPDGDVRIVAEAGSDKTLDEFTRAITIDRTPIRVDQRFQKRNEAERSLQVLQDSLGLPHGRTSRRIWSDGIAVQ